MGQTMTAPIKDKETSSLRNDLFRVGSSCMQGWRITMEDAHTHILGIDSDPGKAFFGVYDGHGGYKVAEFVSKNLHHYILRRLDVQREADHETAIIEGYLECDEKMKQEESLREDMSGCTAVCCIVDRGKVFVGNVGDSRCLACVSGQAVALSVDHKPTDDLEKRRIEAAGGMVDMGRVNGILALSRALGDFSFKRNTAVGAEHQIISGRPDVVTQTLSPDWMFIILACDGIWDVMTNQEAVDFVIHRLALGLEPEVICEELMNHCLANDLVMSGPGCDNMTVVLVCCLHQLPYQSLIDKCALMVRDKASERDQLLVEEELRLNSLQK